MSTEPSGWQSPKTNWTPDDNIGASDLNRWEGNSGAIETGERTLDPAQAPSSNKGSLRQILDWLANRIKAITGATNWYDAPATTLAAAKSHADAAAPHSGHETPSGAQSKVDTHANKSITASQAVHGLKLDDIQQVNWMQASDDVITTSTSEKTFTAGSSPRLAKSVKLSRPGKYRVKFQGKMSDATNQMVVELWFVPGRYAFDDFGGARRTSVSAQVGGTSYKTYVLDTHEAIPPCSLLLITATQVTGGTGYLKDVSLCGALGAEPAVAWSQV